jgi:predicted Co/Zn/Cd cation transporter (cation efflux family)
MPRFLGPPSANHVPATEKQGVARASVVTSAVLVALKLVVGLSTHSLGILSEAAHSSLDLVAAGVTYFSVRVSDKPADREHPFGHGKVESLAAFVETGLLLVACVWIVAEALKRLFFRSVHVEPTVWALPSCCFPSRSTPFARAPFLGWLASTQVLRWRPTPTTFRWMSGARARLS